MTIYKFAGFWRRLTAYSIDSAIIFFIFLVLIMVAGVAFFSGTLSAHSAAWFAELADPERISSVGVVVMAFYTLFFIAYFTYFHGLTGRTPGKKLLGLQVVSADGAPISFGVAFLRSVGYLVSSLLFTLPVGYIWAAFDKKKQAWHDKIANTVVIIREDDGEAAGISIPDREGAGASAAASSTGPSGSSVPPSGGPPAGDAAGPNDQKIP